MWKLLLLAGAVISVTQVQAAETVYVPQVEPEEIRLTLTPTLPTETDIFSAGRSFGTKSDYYLGDGFRMEFENLNSYTDRSGLSDGMGGVNNTSMMLRGLYEFDSGRSWRLKPFIGAGFGMVDVNVGIAGLHANDWVSAYQVKGGMNLAFSQKLIGSVGYNWVKGQKPQLLLRGIPAKVEFPDGGFFLGLNYKLR